MSKYLIARRSYQALSETEVSTDANGKKLLKLHVTRVGKNHDGRFDITKAQLVEMKKNFDANAMRQLGRTGKPEIPLNLGHFREGEAAGWIYDLIISDDGMNLYAMARLNTLGAEMVQDERYQYVSAEWYTNYTDSETKKKYGTVLCGAALVNNPAVKDLERVYAMSKMNAASITFEDVMAFLPTATPDQKAQIIEACGGEVEAPDPNQVSMKKKPYGSDTEADASSSRIRNLEAKLAAESQQRVKFQKESEFQSMLNAGQVVPAQKESFMAGDMVTFASLASKTQMSMTPVGKTNDMNNNQPGTPPTTASSGNNRIVAGVQWNDDYEQAARSNNMTDEEFVKYLKHTEKWPTAVYTGKA